MPFNNHNRDLLSLVHHSERDLHYLLDLSRDLKRAKYAGVEQQRLRGKNIALIFEKTSTRTRCAFEVAAYDEGAHVTYIDPASSQIGHKESMKDTARVLGRMYDAIEYRGVGQEIVEDARGVRRGAGVQRPDRRVPPDADAGRRAHHDRALPKAVARDLLRVRRRRPQQRGQLAAAGGRQARHGRADRGTPRALAERGARGDVPGLRGGVRRTDHVTDDPLEAVARVDFVHTDVWVSMGEPIESWGERIDLLLPFQVNAELMAATGNPRVRFMHCLPAFHNAETTVGRQDRRAVPRAQERHRGHRGRLRVPGQHRLRAGGEPHAHHQGDPRRGARLRAVTTMRIVIALGGNALLQRGQPMTAENQRANIRVAAECIAGVAPGNEIVDRPRQRTPGRPAGAAGRGVPRRRAVPARRAGRPDRGDDRLRHRAGARQPAARRDSRSPPC